VHIRGREGKNTHLHVGSALGGKKGVVFMHDGVGNSDELLF
jgi:hypothetical protein